MKHTLKALLPVLLLLHTIGTTFAQKINTITDSEIKSMMDSLLYSRESGVASSPKVAGAAIGIYIKGKTHCYSYGFANKERQVKVDTNTLFEIGSNTKIFTALMLSAEMAQGKLQGTDFIDKYVPVNKKIRDKVRLTDIANHISGLPTFHDSVSLAELIAKDTTKDPLMLMTDAYMLSTLKKTDSLHNYGEYDYSNLGVGLLGYILQKREGSSYEQLLQRIICRPLGMKHTTSIGDTNSSSLAKGYSGGERAPYINLCSSMQGAGAIKSNITDMMRFIKFQLEGNTALKDAWEISHRTYYDKDGLQMSMGWHVTQKYGTEIHNMRGDTYGASSIMLFNEEHGFGVVVLVNAADFRIISSISNNILAKLLDSSGTQNKFTKPEIAVDARILSSYVGTYELEPGTDAMVSIENGKLFLQLTGQPKGVFKAVEDNWFVMEKYNCQLEFTRDNKGVCNEFILYQNDFKINCKRK